MNTIGHNTAAGEMLRGFVERIESINAQMEELRADKAVVMAEAKAANLVPAGINYIIKKRKMKPSDRAEAEALEDTYLHAMGMAVDNPLFRAVGLMKVDIASREAVVKAMENFVPTNGSITVEAGGAPVRLTRDRDGIITITEVIEKPVGESKVSGLKVAPPKRPVPDVDGDGAEDLGCIAFKADVPIIQNPFPYGDPRRPRWDAGWRSESGTDGMGPDDE